MYHHDFPCLTVADFDDIDTGRQVAVADAFAVDVENAHGFAFGTFDDDAAVGGIDAAGRNIMLVNAVGDEKVDVEGELGTVLLDIGYHEAGLGRAVGEVGVRVGRGAEGGAACGSAEMGLTDVALHCVDGAAGAEYPVLVGLGGSWVCCKTPPSITRTGNPDAKDARAGGMSYFPKWSNTTKSRRRLTTPYPRWTLS